MKSLKYLFAVSLVVMGLAGCSENDTPVYDSDYTALNIWFGTTSTVLDSTTYNYSYTLSESSLTFYARVMGTPVDYDRTFTLEAYDGDLTEADGSYRTTEYTIGAGEYLAQFPIYFDTSKLKDSDSFTQTDGHLYFRMAEKSEFVAGAASMQNLIVVLKNYLDKPSEWDSATYPYRAYSYYFGTYSKVKYQFMIQETGLIDFHISYTATTPYNEETNTISTSYATYLVQVLEVALEEYNSTHDTLLTDESGSLVVF